MQSQTFAPRDGVRSIANGEGLVLLDVGKGLLYTGNATAGQMWREISSGKSPAAIAVEISREYGIPLTTAEEHCAAFLEALFINKLLAE